MTVPFPAVRTRITAILVATVAVVAGCAAPAKDTSGYDKEALRKDVALATKLMDIADLAHAEARIQYVRLLVQRAPEMQLAAIAKLQAGISSVTRAMALDPAPLQGLVQMYIWSRMGTFACENRKKLMAESVPCTCDDIYGRVTLQLTTLAKAELGEKRLAELDRLIAAYQAEHPTLLNVGLLRIDDIASSQSLVELVLPPSEESMLSPVTDAAHQIEQARLLGAQMLWLATRLPGNVADELEGSARLLAQSEVAQRALADLHGLGPTMAATADNLKVNAEAQRELASQIAVLAQDVRGAAARADRALTIVVGALVVAAGIAVGWMLRGRRKAPTP
jgi:hypothetical protein